jgi:hypothetical protein
MLPGSATRSFGPVQSVSLARPVPSRSETTEFMADRAPTVRESLMDECIRHEILALGGLSLAQPHFLPIRNPSLILGEHHLAALHHHGHALNMFKRRLAQGTVHPRSILIATALFMTFELLLGNNAAAAALFERGYELLNQSDLDEGSVWEKDQRIPSPELGCLADVRHMLLRLSGVQNILPFLHPTTRLDMAHGTISASSLSSSKTPSNCLSIEDLERQWREMSLRFMWTRSQIQLATQEDDFKKLRQLEGDVLRLVDENRCWGEALKTRLEKERDDNVPHNLRLMGIQQVAFDLFATHSHDETRSTVFRDLITRCDNILKDSRRVPLRTRLSMDSAALPVLLCVISLCKDLEVRQYAFETARKYCQSQGQEKRQDWIRAAWANGEFQVVSKGMDDDDENALQRSRIKDYLLLRCSAQFSVWLSIEEGDKQAVAHQ